MNEEFAARMLDFGAKMLECQNQILMEQQEMKNDITEIKAEQQEMKNDIIEIKAEQQEMKADIKKLVKRVDKLEEKVDAIPEEVSEVIHDAMNGIDRVYEKKKA